MNKSTVHVLSNASSQETRDRISLLQDEILVEDPSHVVAWPNSSKFLHPLRKVRHEIAQRTPDIVHYWDWNFDLASLLQLAFTCQKTRCLVSFRCAPPRKVTFLQGQLIRFISKRSDKCIVGHDVAADRFRRLGVSDEKVSVIADASKPFSHIGSDEVSPTLRFSEGEKLIGGIAEGEPSEQIKDMIWALDLLRYVDSNVKLLLFGRPKDPWRINRFIRQVGIRSQIHFLPKHQLSSWTEHLSCFWLLNLTDIEREVSSAMLACVPIIASQAAMNAASIIPNQTGIRVAAGNRAELAKVTLSILEDPDKTAEFTCNAQAFSENRMEVQSMLNGYSRIYQSLV